MYAGSFPRWVLEATDTEDTRSKCCSRSSPRLAVAVNEASERVDRDRAANHLNEEIQTQIALACVIQHIFLICVRSYQVAELVESRPRHHTSAKTEYRGRASASSCETRMSTAVTTTPAKWHEGYQRSAGRTDSPQGDECSSEAAGRRVPHGGFCRTAAPAVTLNNEESLQGGASSCPFDRPCMLRQRARVCSTVSTASITTAPRKMIHHPQRGRRELGLDPVNASRSTCRPASSSAGWAASARRCRGAASDPDSAPDALSPRCPLAQAFQAAPTYHDVGGEIDRVDTQPL